MFMTCYCLPRLVEMLTISRSPFLAIAYKDSEARSSSVEQLCPISTTNYLSLEHNRTKIVISKLRPLLRDVSVRRAFLRW